MICIEFTLYLTKNTKHVNFPWLLFLRPFPGTASYINTRWITLFTEFTIVIDNGEDQSKYSVYNKILLQTGHTTVKTLCQDACYCTYCIWKKQTRTLRLIKPTYIYSHFLLSYSPISLEWLLFNGFL